MKKILFFDLDGTLLTTEKKLLSSTLIAIEQLKKSGHIPVIATGRNYELANQVIKDSKISNYILCNGAIGVINHQEYFHKGLKLEQIEHILSICEEYHFDYILVTAYNRYSLSLIKQKSTLETLQVYHEAVPTVVAPEELDADILQIEVFVDQTQSVLFEHILDTEIVRWHWNGIDILPKNVNKSAPIPDMLTHFNIPLEDTIAFGDSDNDLAIFDYVATAIAMENGTETLKKQANLITKTNDQNGIVLALQNLDLI